MIFLYFFCILLFVLLLIVFMLKPKNSSAVLFLKGKKIAHRGLFSSTIPENSIGAFKNAVLNNYPVEFDVQLTKDGQVVVFHDADLFRMCGIQKRIKDMDLKEIQSYKLQNTDERIPLLKDVLSVLQDTEFICEIKPYDNKSTPILCKKTYEIIKGHKRNFSVESFSPFVLLWFRKNAKEVVRGQLAMVFDPMKNNKYNKLELSVLSNLFTNFLARPNFIAYDIEELSFGFKACRHIFKPLCVAWTVRLKKGEKISYENKYFDAFIFEYNTQP